MLSLRELERAVRLADATLRGARLDKLIQLDGLRVVLSFRDDSAPDGRRPLLLSCDPQAARLSVLGERPRAPRTPPPFAQQLRKALGRAVCTGVELRGADRQAVVGLRGKEAEHALLLSILGPRSNLYWLDAEGRVRDALRPLEKTRRALARGEPWRDPETPAPARGDDRWAEVADADFFAAVEAHYGGLEAGREAEERVKQIAQVLDKERRTLERKRAALARDRAAAEGADEDRRRGELLKGALDRVRPGDREVEVEDWETGEPVRIPLDPKQTPKENLDALFRRYRKRSRAVEHLEAQLAELDARLEEHRGLADEFAALADAESPDAEDLARFAERPALRRLLARHRPQAPPRARARPRRIAGREVPVRLLPRRYRSAAGLEIWVGRSDEGNDFLSTRLARGKDLFLHLDGSPGSHVVLRTEGRSDPPSEALLDAAELAVHFSKQKNVSRADVHVSPIKNVSKPRGAKPGLVLVSGGRTLHLRRDPARLQRVLADRIEDDAEDGPGVKES